MKRTSTLALVICSVALAACASSREAHPMVKAAERVLDEITGSAPNPPQSTALATKPAPEKQ